MWPFPGATCLTCDDRFGRFRVGSVTRSLEEKSLLVLSNPYRCCFRYKAWRATVLGSDLQPSIPAVHYVHLRSGFNVGDELGVLAGGAKDSGCLNDFVAFRTCRRGLFRCGRGFLRLSRNSWINGRCSEKCRLGFSCLVYGAVLVLWLCRFAA